MIKQAKIDFSFSQSENNILVNALTEITENPYLNYDAFSLVIDEIINTDILPNSFIDFCSKSQTLPAYEKPAIVVQNCPVDKIIPKLSYYNPVEDKRKFKKTYVSEAFLLIYAKLMKQCPIGYLNVNDGDVFQDIHPWHKLSDTQSQKALKDICFHKDLANHFVRPDWVNILGLRQKKSCLVYTSFTRNIDVLSYLTKQEKKILQQKAFHTPFDDLTVDSDNFILGESDRHSVIDEQGYDMRIFEGRTVGLNPQAHSAIKRVIELLHEHRQRVHILPGILLGEANNESIHCKEVISYDNIGDLQNRWLQKTVNVKNLQDHKQHYLKNTKNIVNG